MDGTIEHTYHYDESILQPGDEKYRWDSPDPIQLELWGDNLSTQKPDYRRGPETMEQAPYKIRRKSST
jgi:hypothetical protein